jgi:TfoX/Sxy family transcriptional regulator of competence genes
MSYNEELAVRVRAALAGRRGVEEKKMFGGLAFLLRGKMFCGVLKGDLVVRVGPERNQEALRQPHTRPLDFTGKSMKGYVYVAPQGYRDRKTLDRWLDWATEFVAALPARSPKVERRTKPGRGSKKKGGSP